MEVQDHGACSALYFFANDGKLPDCDQLRNVVTLEQDLLETLGTKRKANAADEQVFRCNPIELPAGLYAMKEAQRQLREQDPAAVLWVNVRIYTWEPEFDRFLQHLDHGCSEADGRQITVRQPRRQRHS